MNLKQIAQKVTIKQKGKVNLTVAQVTQVIGDYHEVLVENLSASEITAHSAKMLANGEKRLKVKTKKA